MCVTLIIILANQTLSNKSMNTNQQVSKTFLHPSPLLPSFCCQTAQTVLLVITAFLICWMPYHIITMWVEFGTFPLTDASFVFRIVAHCLSYGNSCINPILYAFLSENFRKACRQVFNYHCLCPPPPVEKLKRTRMDTFSTTHSGANIWIEEIFGRWIALPMATVRRKKERNTEKIKRGLRLKWYRGAVANSQCRDKTLVQTKLVSDCSADTEANLKYTDTKGTAHYAL